MRELRDKKLILLAGKGGVGKTTTSCAIALWLARHGKRTLVVTVDPAKRLGDALGTKVGYQETPIEENLQALMVDPRTVIEEYLKRQAPDADAEVMDHPLFKYVTERMPGLNELLAIGKLIELRDAEKYDIIVVDTAPTGHALTFLSAPGYIRELFSEQGMINLVIRGWKFYTNAKRVAGGIKGLFTGQDLATPDIDLEQVFAGIKGEAERIEAMLVDQENTILNVVTNPERLALEETKDILQKVQALNIRVGTIVMNKVQPDALAELRGEFLKVNEDEATKDALKETLAQRGYNPDLLKRVVWTVAFSDLRRQMNLHYVEAMRKEVDLLVVEIPLFKEEVTGIQRLEEFATHLFEQGQPR